MSFTEVNKKLYRWSLTFFDIMAIVTMAFEICVITGNVIMRYQFHSSLSWLDEFAGFGLIWLGFVISVRLMDEDEHFHVDVFIRLISGLKLKIILFFNYTVMIIYLAILTYFGSQVCYRLYFVSPTYTQSFDWFPKSIIFIMIPIASLATIVVLINKLIKLHSKG